MKVWSKADNNTVILRANGHGTTPLISFLMHLGCAVLQLQSVALQSTENLPC